MKESPVRQSPARKGEPLEKNPDVKASLSREPLPVSGDEPLGRDSVAPTESAQSSDSSSESASDSFAPQTSPESVIETGLSYPSD